MTPDFAIVDLATAREPRQFDGWVQTDSELVDFIDGDIDRPIIVGQVHNGPHELPWPAGVELMTTGPPWC